MNRWNVSSRRRIARRHNTPLNTRTQCGNIIMIVSNTLSVNRNMMLEVKAYDMVGKEKKLTQVYEEIGPSTVRKYLPMGRGIDRMRKDKGMFLSLRLLDDHRQPISDNFYW